jgi:hypothetical protein
LGYILDIILSLVIRGAIAIAILNMTIALQGKLSEKTAQANMFNLTTTVSRIMGDEMMMVGYKVSPPFFGVAKKDSIEFTYFNPSVGSQRWVKYALGDSLELSNTANPKDRRLYRCDGASAGTGVRKPVANGVVKMEFFYYDASGNETSTLSSITSFTVHIVMATGESVNGLYPASEWTYRFFPSNIN